MEARSQRSRRLPAVLPARVLLFCTVVWAAGPPVDASESQSAGFRDHKRYPLANGWFASAVYAVDVDGDGLPDVLAPRGGFAAYSRLFVVRNLGGRALSLPEGVPLGFHFYDAVRPADFDGDGDIDIAVSQFVEASPASARELALLLNRGDGTFEAARMVSAVPYQWSITSGELDGDGLPDIVLGGRLAILKNLGRGEFAAPRVLELGTLGWREWIGVGDLDGNGANDLFLCDAYAEKLKLEIFWNDGRGAFEERTAVPGACESSPMELADVNGDGRPDIVACAATVYLNAGGRRFREPVRWAQGGGFGDIFDAADLDADGNVDLLFQSYDEWGSYLSVLYNRGEGSFASARQHWMPGEHLNAMVLGDFDRDGDADIVTASEWVLSHLRNRGDGTFEDGGRYGWQPGSDLLEFAPSRLLSADFDRDGDRDLVAIGDERGGVAVWNRGDGTFVRGDAVFTEYDVAPETGAGPFQAIARDFDQDGDPDIAVLWESYLTLVCNDGSGRFPDFVRIPLRDLLAGHLYLPVGLVSADFDGDGDWDLAFAAFELPEGIETQHSAVFVVRNEGGRDFTARRAYVKERYSSAWYAMIVSLACGDMDADGTVDLVAGTEEFVMPLPRYGRRNSAVEVLRGDGRGGFVLQARATTAGSEGRAVFLGDVDGDGDLDVATTQGGLDFEPPCCESTLQILLNDGKGGLGEILTLNTDDNPVIVAIEDLNGDRLGDLAVGCSNAPRVDIFLNEPRAVPPEILGRFVRGDANGDGTLTLADPVALLTRLFLGGASLPCEKAGDADDDGELRLVDAVYLLRYLFSSGSPPQAPFPHCGLDPTEDSLACLPRAYCP